MRELESDGLVIAAALCSLQLKTKLVELDREELDRHIAVKGLRIGPALHSVFVCHLLVHAEESVKLVVVRNMAFWDHTVLNDDRLTWMKRYILLRQDKSATGNVKFGINSQHGFAMYFNHGDMFLKQFEPNLNGTYPDGGMSFATYTNPMFLEMESLSELQSVAPGATIEHTEHWSLHKTDMPELTDDAIDAFKKQYIED